MAGIPRAYLCSATYEVGGERKFLIREIVSGNRGEDLRREVSGLFLSDITNQGRVGSKTPVDYRSKLLKDLGIGQADIDTTGIFVTGKLKDLNIDEMKREKGERPEYTDKAAPAAKPKSRL